MCVAPHVGMETIDPTKKPPIVDPPRQPFPEKFPPPNPAPFIDPPVVPGPPGVPSPDSPSPQPTVDPPAEIRDPPLAPVRALAVESF